LPAGFGKKKSSLGAERIYSSGKKRRGKGKKFAKRGMLIEERREGRKSKRFTVSRVTSITRGGGKKEKKRKQKELD